MHGEQNTKWGDSDDSPVHSWQQHELPNTGPRRWRSKRLLPLGVLKELEAKVGVPLTKKFDLVFGTSTGAIIAALIALGHSVSEIHDLYKAHVPAVMSKKKAQARTASLSI